MKKNIESLKTQIEDSKHLSIVNKQNVLRILVDEVIIKGNDIEIRHCIPCQHAQSTEISPLRSDGYCEPFGLPEKA